MRRWLVVWMGLSATWAFAQPGGLTVVERHALAATAKEEATVKSLALYLKQKRPATIWDPRVKFWTYNAEGDEATAREIFCWVAHRITYDYRSLYLKHSLRQPEHILKRRYGVCEDYAVLFQALAEEAGLKCVYVWGNVERTDDAHAWNAVCIGGAWRMIDACWAAPNGTWPVSRANYEPKWFTMAPEEFLESHLPDEMQFMRDDFTSFMKHMDPRRLQRIRRRMGAHGVPAPPDWAGKD